MKQILAHIGDLEPDEVTIVQKDLNSVNRYEQRFASGVSTLRERKQEPVDRIREAVLAYEKDLANLVKAARHERRGQLIQALRTQVGSFDTRITEAIQAANPALSQVSLDLQASSQEIQELTSNLEQQNWGRVQMDHQEARRLIYRAEWALSVVSAATFLFSVWASLVLPGQVAKPLVSLKKAVDHAATGNFEIDFELHGRGEVVELARSIKNLTSLLRHNQGEGPFGGDGL